MRQSFYFLTILFLVSINVVTSFSQPTNSYTGNITLPSAEVNSLGKYSDIPVDHFSGVPQIDIPIYTVSDGNLSLPISLSYHASGQVVSQVASRVGAGWSLNAGGMISRTVLGLRDEGSHGYYHNGNNVPIPSECAYKNWVLHASNVHQQYETEPDLFSFNIGGYTGKFYFNLDSGTPVIKTIPKSDVKITPHFQGTNNSAVDYLAYFTIVGTDGTKYFLGKYNGKDGMEQSQFSGNQNPIATAWYVVRIESADGKYNIDFNYQADDYEYVYKIPKNSFTCPNGPEFDFTAFKSKKLSSITSKTETITFIDGINKLDVRPHYQTPGIIPKSLGSISIVTGTYSKKFDLEQSHWVDNEFPQVTTHLNNLLRLNAIQEKSSDLSVTNPSTTFEYNTKTVGSTFFPNRLSRAIDHWGYYNGKVENNNYSNTLNIPFHNPVPCLNGATCTDYIMSSNVYYSDRETHEPSMLIGSLKKITYPTGGSTEFIMEANDYNTTETQTNITDLITVNHAYPFPGNCNTSTTTFNTPASYTFSTLANIKYTYTVTPAISCPLAPNLAIEIKMRNATTNAIIATSGQINFNPGTNNSNTALLSSMFPTVPLGNAVKFEITGINCAAQFKVFSEITQNVNLNKKVGGLRVKTITQKDGGLGSPDMVTEYQYKKSVNNTLSSGVLFYKPQYWFTNTWVTNHSLPCAPSYPNCGQCSNGIQDGNETGVDCGGSCDTPCNLGAGCHIIFTETPVVPLSSFEGYHIGYEEVAITKPDGAKTTNEFFIEPPFIATGTYLEDNKYPIEPHQARINTGKLKIENKIRSDNQLIEKTENFIYLTDSYEVSSDRMMKVFRYGGCSVGQGQWWLSNSYHIRTKPYRISSTENTLDNVLSAQVFSYDPSNRFLMPISKSFTNSDGLIHKEEYTYNHDYDNSTGLRDELVSKNIIQSPFRTVLKVNNLHVDGPEIGYAWFNLTTGVFQANSTNAFPRPHQIYRYEKTFDASGNLLGTGGITLQATINSYDSYGNIQQVTTPNWQPETYEWFSNGLLKKKTFMDHVKDYSYHTGTRLLSSIKEIDGQITYFEYDKLSRLAKQVQRKVGSIENVKSEYTYHYKEPSGDIYNWVKTKTTYTATTNSNLVSQETKEILDGLGRPLQTIKINHSPDNKDVVFGKAYDNKGRLWKEYLPVKSTSNTGEFFAVPSTTKYTETLYESSPLNRVVSVTPPGTIGTPGSWYATTISYGSNTSNDVTNLVTGNNYAQNTLSKMTITDPMNNRTILLKDKKGREVMSWKTNVSYSSHTRTYTLYDNKDRVTTVVPPGATLTTPHLVYKYTYDHDDKVLTKTVPGKGLEKFIYNNRDLLTFTQDAKWVATNDWLHTKYDSYGRPLNSGRYTHSMAGDPSGDSNPGYSDQYMEIGYFTLLSDGVKLGKTKQTKDKIIGTANTWIQKDYNYDAFGRVSTITGSNHLYNNITAESVTITYDFADNVMTENRIHKPSATLSEQQNINKRWTYDASGRVQDHFTSLNGTETKISNQNYNFRDELIEKNLGAVTIGGTSTYLQSLDYEYNDQGWLTKINQPTLGGSNMAFPVVCPYLLPNPGVYNLAVNPDPNDLFYMELNYDLNTTGVTGLPTNTQKSGNISQIAWRIRGRDRQAYNYNYDYLDRMTASTYYDVNASNVSSATNRYNENLTYDVRGNILSLNRTGFYMNGSTCAFSTIDNLTYTYASNTNKLTAITDASAATPKPKGFNPGPGGSGFDYDLVGNLKSDTYKGIANIVYNYLNLPITISWGTTKSIEFVYDASGNKLSKTVKTGATINSIQDYVLGVEYNKLGAAARKIEAIYHNEGRYFNTSVTSTPSWRTEYTIKDHLGNARITFTDKNLNGKIDVTNTSSNEILQENHYYAFGMAHEGTWQMNDVTKDNLYMYNSKELNTDHGLNWSDYGARWYDACVGRWSSVDPLAEDAPDWTPYRYGFNNPLSFIDPSGMNEKEFNVTIEVRQEENNYTYGGYDYNTGEVTLNSSSKTTKTSTTAKLRNAKVNVSNKTKGFGYVKSYPFRDGNLYEVPLYLVTLSGIIDINGLNLNISSDFKAYRFGVHLENINGTPKMVGFQDEQSYDLSWDDITTMPGNAWRVTGGWFLHKGPDDPLTQAFGSIGCIEICGVGEWERFNNYVTWFTGSKDPNEITKNKLLQIYYEKAIKPNLKKK